MLRITVLTSCLLLTALSARPARADDWPQWRGPLRDGVWREDGVADKLPARLTIKWRAKIGAGYAGPAVAAGRVYVTDRILKEGAKNPDDAFARDAVTGSERILCLDAESGTILWKHEYPSKYTISYPYGPRATPTVDGGRVYSVGAMGDFFSLDAVAGKVLWSKNFVKDFGTEINTWGLAAAPLVDGQKVILLTGGAGGAAVAALDKETGDKIWTAVDAADPGYAPPVIFEAGGVRQLIIWTPQALHSLNPETGEVFWRRPFPLNSGLAVATPIFDPSRNLLLVSAFYDGPLMMRLESDRPAATLLWKGKSESEKDTDGLHALMCTPLFQGDHLYGVCSYGQLRCLEVATGKRVWESLEATGSGRWWNAFLVKHRDRVFIANEQGDLIIARLSPEGYKELSRAPLIAPTRPVLRRTVVWSHPAFANRRVYARNDEEILCADLAARTE